MASCFGLIQYHYYQARGSGSPPPRAPRGQSGVPAEPQEHLTLQPSSCGPVWCPSCAVGPSSQSGVPAAPQDGAWLPLPPRASRCPGCAVGFKFICEHLKVVAKTRTSRARAPRLFRPSGRPWVLGSWIAATAVPHLEYTCPRLGARRRPPAPGQSSSSSSSSKKDLACRWQAFVAVVRWCARYGMVVMLVRCSLTNAEVAVTVVRFVSRSSGCV